MRGLSIYIDRITHSIEDASTFERVETDIIALHEKNNITFWTKSDFLEARTEQKRRSEETEKGWMIILKA